MINTEIHKFKKPEHSDDILQTITNLSENFEKLDGLVEETAQTLNGHLIAGKEYARGKLIWNALPAVDGNVGWVNVRKGKFALTWQKNTTYNIGSLVMTQANNGHIYECIENGVSGVSQPNLPLTPNASVNDLANSAGWIANKVYEIDDIVVPTNGNQLYYYKCVTGGTSGISEPIWSTITGVQINDGSARWQVYKTVRWREVGVSCDFKNFGKIY